MTAWLVLIGTLFGGAGLRYVDHWLSKRKVALDEGAAWRKELREEVTAQKTEIDDLEAQVEVWRAKYYDLRDAYTELKVQLELALHRIKAEANRAEKILPDPPPDDNPP